MRPREIAARDERAVCAVERVRSRGGQGGPTSQRNEAKPRVGHGGFAVVCSPSVGFRSLFVSVVIVGGRFVQEFAFRVAEAVPGSGSIKHRAQEGNWNYYVPPVV